MTAPDAVCQRCVVHIREKDELEERCKRQDGDIGVLTEEACELRCQLEDVVRRKNEWK